MLRLECNLLVTLASSVLALTFNTVVFVLTVAKTIRLAVELKQANFKHSLVYVILRDGELNVFLDTFCAEEGVGILYYV